MKPIKQNDLMRLLRSPRVGDTVEVLTEVMLMHGKRGIVQKTWMDAVTSALIVEVKFDDNVTIKFYEDVLRVVDNGPK